MAVPLPKSIPVSGSLCKRALPELLLALYRARVDTVLCVRRGHTKKRITFAEGAPIDCASSLEKEGLPHALAEAGVISQSQRSKSDAAIAAGAPEVAAVMKLGAIDAKTLLVALKKQIRLRLLECFGWPDGEYQFEDLPQDTEGARPLRVDPYLLVHEGLTQHAGPEQLLMELSGHSGKFARARKGFEEVAERLPKTPEFLDVFDAIRAERNMDVVLGNAARLPAALCALWMVERAHLLEFSDTPFEAEASGIPALAREDIEIEVTGTAKSTAAVASPTRTPEIDRNEPVDDAARSLGEKIQAVHASLADVSHYELLEIAQDASDGEVRKAYFKAAKRYHPDALAKQGLDGLRSCAGEIFARVTEAHETLREPERRERYDAHLRGEAPEEIDTGRLAQAESFFRKGSVLIRMGDFRGALEYLEPAVELWPDECAYQSALGWALFKKNPPEIERALTHLDEALRMDPDDAETHERMGQTLRAAGDEKAAAEHAARAQALA